MADLPQPCERCELKEQTIRDLNEARRALIREIEEQSELLLRARQLAGRWEQAAYEILAQMIEMRGKRDELVQTGRALHDSLTTAVKFLKDGPPAAPPLGHVCGPEGNCNGGCHAWAAFCEIVDGMEAVLKRAANPAATFQSTPDPTPNPIWEMWQKSRPLDQQAEMLKGVLSAGAAPFCSGKSIGLQGVLFDKPISDDELLACQKKLGPGHRLWRQGHRVMIDMEYTPTPEEFEKLCGKLGISMGCAIHKEPSNPDSDNK